MNVLIKFNSGVLCIMKLWCEHYVITSHLDIVISINLNRKITNQKSLET
jgi:hypothetical protein